MDIGTKPLSEQKSPIIINKPSFNEMVQNVNILRKPHFDNNFNTSFDNSGWKVALRKGVTKEMPFDVSIKNWTNTLSITTNKLKVVDGRFTLNEDTLTHTDTNSDFTSDSGYLVQNDYIGSGADTYITIVLSDSNGVAVTTTDTPTNFILKANNSYSEADYVVARVQSTDGGVLINQYYHGDMWEEYGLLGDGSNVSPEITTNEASNSASVTQMTWTRNGNVLIVAASNSIGDVINRELYVKLDDPVNPTTATYVAEPNVLPDDRDNAYVHLATINFNGAIPDSITYHHMGDIDDLDQFRPFKCHQYQYKNSTQIYVQAGNWIRNGVIASFAGGAIDCSGIGASSSGYIYARLITNATNDPALIPNTSLQVAVSATDLETGDTWGLIKNLCYFTTDSNSYITTVKQYWMGHIDDQTLRPDHDSWSNASPYISTITVNPTSGEHQFELELYRADDNTWCPASEGRIPQLVKDESENGDLQWIVEDADLNGWDSNTYRSLQRRSNVSSRVLQLYQFAEAAASSPTINEDFVVYRDADDGSGNTKIRYANIKEIEVVTNVSYDANTGILSQTKKTIKIIDDPYNEATTEITTAEECD